MLDEVTVDLDVVARMDLLEFFKEECEQVLLFDFTFKRVSVLLFSRLRLLNKINTFHNCNREDVQSYMQPIYLTA